MTEPPQFQDRESMWQSLHIDVVSVGFPAISAYVTYLRDYFVNGSVMHGCFRLGDSKVFDWYSSRNRLQEAQFFWRIWGCEPISSYFGISDVDEDSNTLFEWSSPFVLGGSLAWALDGGGAYEKPNWAGSRSKEIGESAANELIGGDFDDSLVFQSHSAWCSFFFDVAWDYTWVVFTKKPRLLQVILATDID